MAAGTVQHPQCPYCSSHHAPTYTCEDRAARRAAWVAFAAAVLPLGCDASKHDLTIDDEGYRAAHRLESICRAADLLLAEFDARVREGKL